MNKLESVLGMREHRNGTGRQLATAAGGMRSSGVAQLTWVKAGTSLDGRKGGVEQIGVTIYEGVELGY